MTKIRSPFANCEATLMTETRDVRFRGEMFSCQHSFYRCDETGIDFTTSEQDDESILQIYDQYRKKYGIPSPEELKATRKKYGLSAAKMSEVLGMGINQYRLYEDGEMPSLAVGKVLKSIEDPYIFKRFLDNSVNQFSKKDFEQMESKVAAVVA